MPTGKRGRQPAYGDAAIQTCLTMKVLFGMALRQTTGFVESLLQLIGLDWAVPDFSTLSRRQKGLKVNIPYRGSEGPLHLLIDSTGIKVEGEGEWNARKHGGAKRRVWRKIHIGIDEKTLEIRAAEFTTSDVGDVEPVKRHRFQRTGEGCCPNCSIRSRPSKRSEALPPTAHSTPASAMTRSPPEVPRPRRAFSRTSGVHALHPPRKNARFWKPDTSGAIARNEILRTSKCVGRTIWRRWSGYHRRSRVETKMHCVKLLGQRLAARDFDRQVAEFQIRVAILNGFTALGTPITEVAG